MPINARFQYRGQPWAPYLNAACQISAVAFIFYVPWAALATSLLGMSAVWYRADQGKRQMQHQLEALIEINIGKALLESKTIRIKPSDFIEEAVSGIEKES